MFDSCLGFPLDIVFRGRVEIWFIEICYEFEKDFEKSKAVLLFLKLAHYFLKYFVKFALNLTVLIKKESVSF